MGQDLPDGTKKITIAFTGGFVGLEELAVRLGAATRWNLLGNVVFADTFEHGPANWLSATLGSGSAFAWDDEFYHVGALAGKLTAGNVANAYCRMYKYTWHPGDSDYAFGAYLGITPPGGSPQRIEVRLRFSKDGTYTYAYIRYDAPTTTLSVLSAVGVYTTLDSSLDLRPEILAFVPFRLDLDLTDLEYKSLKIADHEYDLSAYSLPQESAGAGEDILVEIYHYAIGTAGGDIYVSGPVLAYNVP